MNLSYDQCDAILRDGNVPGDVRAAVQQEIGVRNYLNRIEFVEDPQSGMTNVTEKQAQDIAPVSEAPSTDTAPQQTADTTVPDPNAPPPAPDPNAPPPPASPAQ